MLEGDVDVVEHLRFTGDDVDEGVVQIVGVQVVQANPVKGQLAQLGEQRPQHPLVVEVDAVAGDVLGDDDELLHPGVGQGLGLRQQGLHGTAAVAAPQLGNDTEGAPVVAALGDLQVGGVGGGGGDARPVLLRVVDIPEAVGRAPGHQLLQGGDDLGVAAGAHDAVHLGQLLHQLVLIALGQAAGDQQLAQLPLLFQLGQLQDILNGLALGGVDKAAGVEHRRVRPLGLGGDLMPSASDQCHHLLGVHQILGAAQGYKCNLQ